MNTVLIMCSSERTCSMIREFLSVMDGTSPPGQKGRKFMESKLRSYLYWKGRLAKRSKEPRPTDKSSVQSSTSTKSGLADSGISEALKRKDARNKDRTANRRRVRGGTPGQGSREGIALERSSEPGARSGAMGGEHVLKEEAEELAVLCVS